MKLKAILLIVAAVGLLSFTVAQKADAPKSEVAAEMQQPSMSGGITELDPL